MDSGNGHDVPEEDHDFNPDGTDTSKAEAALKAKLSRKRTKTGCLTCRKRRIKCGEERPVCKNCIKSKRHCEGYSQRVVFKPPTFEYRAAPNGGAHITFQAGPMAAPMLSLHPGQIPQYMIDPNMYPDMMPRPDQPYMPYLQHPMGHYVPGPPPPQPMQHPGFAMPPQQIPVRQQAPVPMDYNIASNNMQQQPQQTFQTPFTNTQAQAVPSNIQSVPTSQFQTPSQVTPNYGINPPRTLSQASAATQQIPWSATTTVNPSPTSQLPTTSVSPPQKFEPAQTPLRNNSVQSWTAPTYTPRPELSHPIDYQPGSGIPHSSSVATSTAPSATGPLQSSEPPTPDLYEYQQPPWHGTPSHSQWLADAAVEVVDDDYYDVGSDEDMDIEEPTVKAQDLGRQRTLNKVLMSQHKHFNAQNMQIRRYDTFLQEGMLDHYKVEEHANPLKNPATARVFAHFISVTGPSLSVFERHPVNTSVLFTEGSVPFSQQGLWTYTMPMAALHHQGLLHAMLALSSLHIARIQGASTTPSIRHYAWALKRIHSCVSSQNPKKRLQVTTIAASMLLGFYEIMTADHMKWNAHLAGARQLFLETDFAAMNRQYRQLKREKMARDSVQRRNSISAYFNREEELNDQFYDVDESLISNFVGHEVRYDDHGFIETPQSRIPPSLELSNFAILKDLFWWYCKQDAYQSIVSGNPLLMDYGRWTDCPPRAAIGRPEALYGSFDHLMLILGRIADFASRDRERKLKQMTLNGGQWRPAPGMNIPRPPGPPPGQGPPQGPPAGPPPQAGPAFFGMAPPPRQNVQMPASYNPAQAAPGHEQHAKSPEAFDMQVATAAALEQYGKIRAALRDFVTAMSGEAFQPLDADCHTPLDTSFGKALFYRSYDIGCLWAVYNMCEIIAIRSHPHMHPASHAAAAIAAKDTAFYAEQIGRIAAGIAPGPAAQPLNPTLGSALCESCMPSFFAAVQYQRPDQRHETVMRIFGIALRTGWGSAELIANGCETSWVKAAEAGRGPPYQRVVRPQHSNDPRLNGSWERLAPNLDPNMKPEEMDDTDRRLVKVKANARLNWAIGIMGTEDDVGKG